MGQKHNIIKGKKPFRRILREKITFGHFFSQGGGSNKFRHFSRSYSHDLREDSIFWITGLYNTSHQRAKKWIKCPVLMAQFEEKLFQANCDFATLFYRGNLGENSLFRIVRVKCMHYIRREKRSQSALFYRRNLGTSPPQIVICLSLRIV